MFHTSSARQDSLPRVINLLAVAVTPWHMLQRAMTQRLTGASLSRLDDHMLKDIGLSRGSIDSAILTGRYHP